MIKEYLKFTAETLNENLEVIRTEENVVTCLIADESKVILQKSTGIKGTRVDIGIGDSEENYEEVDDPKYIEKRVIEQDVVGSMIEEVQKID